MRLNSYAIKLVALIATLTMLATFAPGAASEPYELQTNEESVIDLGIMPSPEDEVHAMIKARQMALLLPLTGLLAGPGLALRDGFLAAKSESEDPKSITIKMYDTNQADAATLYQQAVTDGAEYIVGPLTKGDVAKVAALEHPVPTLLLNELTNPTNPNAWQFGLSPSNEARLVADKAHQDGLSRALIIAPAGDWGDEVVTAFANQWQTHGGQITDTLQYQNSDDLSNAIKNALQITDSQARFKRLQQALGQHIQSTPRRRQDFDMIFLLAYPSKARQIMPMLNYYYAGDIPVYATSTVYSGTPNPMKDKDLNGIKFTEMPWVFTHPATNKNWPEQLNSYNRLYALGMDSFNLSNQLNQLLLAPNTGIQDNSGVLYLNANRQIVRVSSWGQFRLGKVVALTS